jgi:hypothetical protein
MRQLHTNNSILRLKRITGIGLAAVLFIMQLPLGARAEQTAVPLDIQVKLFLASLAYEQRLTSTDHKPITIGCIYLSTSAQSKQHAEDFMEACENYKDKTIAGRRINALLFPYAGTDDLTSTCARQGIGILYIPLIPTDLCREITRVTRTQKLLSFTSTVDLVADCGLSMAVGVENNKPRIYLNLSASRAEGADFSSKLLRVVTIMEVKEK